MPKVKKNKRFSGRNRWEVAKAKDLPSTPTQTQDNSSPGQIETVSSRKIRSTPQRQEELCENNYSYRLVELSSLVRACQSLHACEEGGELIYIDDERRRYGNSSVIVIKCTMCDKEVELQTSGNESDSWKPQSSMDVNRRVTYAASEMGVGREAMSVMCDVLNMPPPCNHSAWDKHMESLHKALKEVVDEQLETAREKVRTLYQDEEGDEVEIAVTYDGPWSKRGYTANFGVGFIISVDTGEVLDYGYESKLCLECTRARQDLGEDSPEFDIWFIGHKDTCTQSHVGSSGSMECSIAKGIWERSKYYNLQYKYMICDGDSKAYNSVWNIYGSCELCEKWENTKKSTKAYKDWVNSDEYRKWRDSHDSGTSGCSRVMKLDCVGHVQKRMGTHLRELRKRQPKLKDGKSVKGSKHRLTDKAIDKLQTYYGNAIRANVKPGRLTTEQQQQHIAVMQKAIMAVLYHCCEISDNEERHLYCPVGDDSWCNYKKNGTLQRKDHHLDGVFFDFLLPEFKRLSSYSLLLRCLPGYSQNANESLNSLVWNRAPKHRYKGPLAIEMAVISALLYFNCGAGSRHEIMKAANIPCGEHSIQGSNQKDEARISHSIRKTEEKEKKRRRKIRQAKLAAKLAEKEGESSYSSGKYNELDPLLPCSSSSDSDDVPLAQLLTKEQGK